LDSKGRPATIAPTDVAITDRKQPANSITSLHSGDGLPLRLGLLIDTSTSTTSSSLFEDAVGKSIDFAKTALVNPDDKAFVLRFSGSPRATAFMNREQFLRFQLEVKPGAGTTLYDSIVLACTERMMKVSPTEIAHFALVVLSDGEDNASHFSLDRRLQLRSKPG
jgi:hypothetical protein